MQAALPPLALPELVLRAPLPPVRFCRKSDRLARLKARELSALRNSSPANPRPSKQARVEARQPQPQPQPAQAAQAQAMPAPAASSSSSSQPEVCRFWRSGSCRRGAQCPLAHTGEREHKDELCKFFL
jgi:pyruvate/2-oxoglutarate dehydrogenase complex dihydrolipoamide acyltransferase (E2) component